MPKSIDTGLVYRIIDANINRAKEGLRVCEEIARFVLNSRSLTLRLKETRHQVELILADLSFKKNVFHNRNARYDVGKDINTIKELKRKSCADIFFANIQRVKESLRVLEEFSKLKSAAEALRFKKLRYDVYDLEKKIAQKVIG